LALNSISSGQMKLRASVGPGGTNVNLSRHLNEYSTFDAKIERARGQLSENESAARSFVAHSLAECVCLAQTTTCALSEEWLL
jgi:hypothetical protein